MSENALDRARTAALEELARTPLPRPWWKDAALLVGVNVLVTLGCTLALVRGGLAWDRAAPGVMLAVALPLLLVAVLGALGAVMPLRAARLWAFVGLAGVAGAAVAMGAGGEGGGAFFASGMPCMTTEVVAAVVPTLAALGVLTRFAYSPLRMFVAGLGAGAAGLFALHLHCPIGTFTHLAAFHVLPWVGVALAAAWARGRLRSRSFAP